MANWAKIKIAYLEGQKVIEIAKKHKVKAQTIYNKALDDKWKVEKSKIQEEIEDNFKTEIKELVELSLPVLKGIITDDSTDDEGRLLTRASDKINAIKAVLDISGLKTQETKINAPVPIDHSFKIF